MSTVAPDQPVAVPSVWDVIRESIRGQHGHDYTQGPIGRAIVLLAIPMVLEMVLESVFAVVDVFFVARLGPDAVATVGLTESMMAIVYALCFGISIGATAMVARRIGENDPQEAAHAAAQTILLGLVVSAVLATIGVTFADDILRLIGASPSVVATGSNYTRVMLGGNVVVLMLFVLNGVFRGAGDAAIAMRVLWLANAINIVLAPSLVFGVGPLPELGVTGAAVGTTIGRGIGALYALSRLLRPGGRVRLHAHQFRPDPKMMARIIRLSSTATFQLLIGTASWLLLVKILSRFGSSVLAGYTIGIRIIIFALLPSWGLSNAAATMVGQSLGAGKPDRAEASVWKAGFYNMCFLGIVGLIFVVLARPIISIFTDDPTIAPHAVNCLRIVAAGFLFYAYGMVITQSFNGAGDTWTPTWLNLIVFWLWEIPLAWVLAVPLGLGPSGAFIAITVAFSTLALASAAVFRRGRWKAVKV